MYTSLSAYRGGGGRGVHNVAAVYTRLQGTAETAVMPSYQYIIGSPEMTAIAAAVEMATRFNT